MKSGEPELPPLAGSVPFIHNIDRQLSETTRTDK